MKKKIKLEAGEQPWPKTPITEAPSKMPPKKKPEPPSDVAKTIALFAHNLELIRGWYRTARTPGHELGHYVLLEIVMRDVHLALEKALKGETWTPPANVSI